MKKVIFVGGTGYSGSTFFHLILANDRKGFACGEIMALFRPWHSGHLKLISRLENEECRSFWKKVQENGEDFIYETIFDLRPDVEIIVQSSKNPFWIRSQNENLQKKGIQFRNILIWKTPLEYAQSAQKRGLLKNWDKGWLNDHRKYFSLIRNWRAVKYFDIIKGPDALEAVCQYLGIPYYPGKEEFWNKEQCIIGGNRSARFHLQSRDKAERLLKGTFDKNRIGLYRKIYYSEVEDDQLKEMVSQKVNNSRQFDNVMKMLNQYDVTTSPEYTQVANAKDAQFSVVMLQLRRLKYELYSIWGRSRYRPE